MSAVVAEGIRLRVWHRTVCRYADTVSLSHHLACLTPRTLPRQKILSTELDIGPEPATRSSRTDYFGNSLTHFAIQSAHRTLRVEASSVVHLLPLPPLPRTSPAWETIAAAMALDAAQTAYESTHIPWDAELAAYARTEFTAGRPIVEAALALQARIKREFVFDPKATTISTPVREVLHRKRGVCQDFAHLMIGCLRSIGLSARYVSGYLRTRPPPGRPRIVGADASHAWLALHCGEHGWLDLDPTNDMVPSLDHVTVAWGRDYDDVAPLTGLIEGGGAQDLDVGVDVAPADEV
ncbi:transglutaminase family protein [Zavarzinia sp. CC-PAN008]|uniref:transglutaminase family protein n=1 Tax=Zavarzinia sp. CC-PAN008 TaxID=3243332 RepID=UPI003F7499DC